MHGDLFRWAEGSNPHMGSGGDATADPGRMPNASLWQPRHLRSTCVMVAVRAKGLGWLFPLGRTPLLLPSLLIGEALPGQERSDVANWRRRRDAPAADAE